MAEDTSGIGPGPGDARDADPWDVVLDEEFVAGAPIKESELGPTARLPHGWQPRSGGHDGDDPDGDTPLRGRHPRRLTVWLSFMVFMICAGLVVSQSFLARRINSADSRPHDATAKPLVPGGTALSAVTGTAVAVSPGSTDRAAISAAAAFPGTLSVANGQTYTRVTDTSQTDCTTTDRVSGSLADLIGETHGCLALDVALYKDTANDQFTVAAFTMRQAADSVGLMAQLAGDASDVQVSVVQPPTGSGLPTLAGDTGAVQSFTGAGRVMIVGVAQWSDGRPSDAQGLATLLAPLIGKVADTVGTYEGSG